MSLLSTQSRAPLQGKLWADSLWSDVLFLGDKIVGLAAVNKQRRMRWFLVLLGFFVLGFAAFMASLMAVPQAEAEAPAQAPVHIAARPLELHIADNGLILLRSAKVSSIVGSTITLETDWGATKFNWTVHTDASQYDSHKFGTKFLTRDGTPMTMYDLQVGDLVTVTGALEQNASSFVVNADAVRLSAQ